MRARDDVSSAGSSHQEAQAAASLRGGRRAPLQTNGLLFQRSALLRRKGSNDLLCQITNPGARRKVQPARGHFATGEFHLKFILKSIRAKCSYKDF